MNQKFQAAITQKDDVCYLKLSGVLDEDNGLEGLRYQIPSGTAIINLSEIERINASGVRDWLDWLGKLEQHSTSVVLVECSSAIVAQINAAQSFCGTGALKSFFAPYFCPACDLEKVLLIEAAEMAGKPPKAPTCRCDECSGIMDFDDKEESYFAFLSSGCKIADDPKIDAAIKEMIPAGGRDESKIRTRRGIPAVSSTGASSGAVRPLPRPALASAASPPPAKPKAASQVAPAARASQPRLTVYLAAGVLLLVLALLAYVIFGRSS